MIGKSFSHYQIIGKLGAGGMGVVYRAQDTKLKREVAIKVLPEAFSRDKERMKRFEREAQVLASLNHPNIAAIYAILTKTASYPVSHAVAGDRGSRELGGGHSCGARLLREHRGGDGVRDSHFLYAHHGGAFQTAS